MSQNHKGPVKHSQEDHPNLLKSGAASVKRSAAEPVEWVGARTERIATPAVGLRKFERV